MTLGERLKQRRLELGLTLEQVGKGVKSSKSYIWEIENKPTLKPSFKKIVLICNILKLPIAELAECV